MRAPAGARAEPRWRDRFLAALDDHRVRRQLDPSGDLRDGAAHLGRWELVDLAVMAGQPVAPPCPYVGPVIGGFTWEWWAGHVGLGARRWLTEAVLDAARGYLVRTDDGRRFESVVREDFPIVEAGQKHGFADGSFFLDSDPGYVAHVRGAIAAGLAALGLEAGLITYGTSHNPHRFDDLRGRGGWQTLETSARTLALWGSALALPAHREALGAIIDPASE